MIFYVATKTVEDAQALVELASREFGWRVVLGKVDGRSAFFEMLPAGVEPLRRYLMEAELKWTERERTVFHG